MPELPEVERCVRRLRIQWEGRQVTNFQFLSEGLRSPFPQILKHLSAPLHIRHVLRKGKYIIFEGQKQGEGFVLHLGMSGNLRMVRKNLYKPRQHDHCVIEGNHDKVMVFKDVRRFGSLQTLQDAQRVLDALGICALTELTPQKLMALTKNLRGPIKPFLLNQEKISGLGNIYANEALFRAGIHPERPAKSLSIEEHIRLVESIRAILEEAIDKGGSSIRDFKSVEGQRGGFQRRHQVYNKLNRPCLNGCGGRIKRITQAGRSSFFCPSCQK